MKKGAHMCTEPPVLAWPEPSSSQWKGPWPRWDVTSDIYWQSTCHAGLENVSGKQHKFPAARDRALILSVMKSCSSQTDFTNVCSAVSRLMKIATSWASPEMLIHSEGFGSFVHLSAPLKITKKPRFICMLLQFLRGLTRLEARERTTIGSSSSQHLWPQGERER